MHLARVIGSLALLSVTATPVIARAQESSDALSLAGRTSLVFGLGLTGAREAAANSNGQTTARATGEVVSLALNHWVRPQVAVSISASVLNANAGTTAGTADADVITPILFGLSFSPRAWALTPEIRPYASIVGGPYFRHVSSVGSAAVSASSESVAGARFGIGANWFVARHFLLSLEGVYHAVSRFENPGPGAESPNGFGISLGLGVHWGRSKPSQRRSN
jgi:hypothetical protein